MTALGMINGADIQVGLLLPDGCDPSAFLFGYVFWDEQYRLMDEVDIRISKISNQDWKKKRLTGSGVIRIAAAFKVCRNLRIPVFAEFFTLWRCAETRNGLAYNAVI